SPRSQAPLGNAGLGSSASHLMGTGREAELRNRAFPSGAWEREKDEVRRRFTPRAGSGRSNFNDFVFTARSPPLLESWPCPSRRSFLHAVAVRVAPDRPGPSSARPRPVPTSPPRDRGLAGVARAPHRAGLPRRGDRLVAP